MERINPTVSGSDPNNWGTNDGVTRNGKDANNNPINGTPKQANSTTIPTPTYTATSTTTPTTTSTPTATLTHTPTPTPTAAPLLISEVVYDGTTSGTEGDEFVEIFNPTTSEVALSNYKVGDKETQGGGEGGMYRFPDGSTIGAQGLVVVAKNAAQFQARFGSYPDYEVVTSGSGYTDTPDVPNLTQYTAWGSGKWALSNSGDEVLLLGPGDQIVDAIAYKSGNYTAVGVTGNPSASEPNSLQRIEDWDTDDMLADFAIAAANPAQRTLLPDPPASPPSSPSLPDGMYAYFGCLHSHSTYSDGSGPPRYAYAVGRANNLHFLALTDHSHMFNDAQWADTLARAEAATVDGGFIALRGFEWTSTASGHLSVFATDTYASRDDPNYDTLAEFYAWLASEGNAIAQFNHPFSDSDFDDFAYSSAADEKIALLEVGNGSEPYYYTFEGAYNRSLAADWHVGPANNGDTDTAHWGADTPHRTGVVAPALTKANLLSALRARRTFATEDGNLALALQSGSAWMGSTVTNRATIPFTVTAVDPDGEPITLTLYRSGQAMASRSFSGATSYTWNVTAAGGANSCYFVKGVQGDGNTAYTSPIWTDDTPIPPEPTPTPMAIADVRWKPLGSWVIVEGVVTVRPYIYDTRGREMVIQDGSAGITVYYSRGGLSAEIEEGDLVQVSGILDEHYGLREIKPGSLADVIRLGSGAAVTPWRVATGDVGEGTEGSLLQVHGIVTDRGSLWVDDGSGPAKIYIKGATGINQWSIPLWAKITVIGVGYQHDEEPPYDSDYEIWPRRQSDLILEQEPTPVPGPPAPPPTPAPSLFLTISEARAIAKGTRVTIEGQVTAPPGLLGKGTMYIGDGRAGIRVYLSGGEYPALAEGDRVRVTGLTGDYYGERQIKVAEASGIQRLGEGEPLAPVILKTGEVSLTREGLLIQVSGYVTGYGRNEIRLDDGSGEVKVYIKSSTGIEKPWVEKREVLTVVGIVSQYESEPELLPRYQEDIALWPPFLPEVGGRF